MNITTFNAFKNPNYRLYFSGQSLSLIGTWMQKTAVVWVVYKMTGSAYMLGVTALATQLPITLFSIFGGIVSDRFNRYRVLLLTQVLSMIQAILMAILVLTGKYQVWEILTLSVILGTINAFDVPARQPLVHEMITDKEELPNALALNSSMVNLAKALGPALSGIVLKEFGAGICFLINAISFVAVITSLLMMKLPKHIPSTNKKKVATDLADGFAYVKNTPVIGVVMLMLAFTSMLVLSYNTLLPVYAKVIFAGDAATYGYLNGFIGLGSVLGAIFLASLKKGSDLKFVLLVNTVVLGIGLILFSHTTYLPFALLFAVITGFGAMSQTTISNTIIQFNSDKQMRGRVISILLLSIGLLPVGAYFVGAISQRIGAPNMILAQGIIAIMIAAAFAKFLSRERIDKKRTEQMTEEEEDAEEVILEKI